MEREDLEDKPKLNQKIRAVVCGMLVNLLIGSYYCYSNINPYVAKYLQTDATNTIVVQQIWISVQSVSTILAVKVADYIGYWWANLISFVLFSLLHLFISWVTDYMTFLLVYGIFAGAFIGIGYLQALYISWTYFPEHKSIVTGIILFCTGISATILSPVTTAIVNPDNLSSKDPRYGDRVPILFRYLALIYGVITVIGCLLQPPPFVSKHYKKLEAAQQAFKKQEFRDDKHKHEVHRTLERHNSVKIDGKVLNEDHIHSVHTDELHQELRQHGCHGGESHSLIAGLLNKPRLADLILPGRKFHKEEPVSTNTSPQPGHELENWSKEKKMEISHHGEAIEKRLSEIRETHYAYGSVREVFRDKNVWILMGMGYFGAIYQYFVNSNWKDYYQRLIPGTSDSDMALILSYGAIANSVVRVIAGFVLVKISFRYLYWIQIALGIFGAFTFLAFINSYGVGVLYMIMALGAIGLQFTLFPTACCTIFGSTIGPKIYPWVFMCFSLGNFTQYFLYRFYGKPYNPSAMFYIFGAFACFGAAISFFLWKRSVSSKNAVRPSSREGDDGRITARDEKEKLSSARAETELESKSNHPSSNVIPIPKSNGSTPEAQAALEEVAKKKQ